MPVFVHHDLALLNPSFDSPLVDVLNELEYLRRLELGGSTPAPVFFQLKSIFHMLESLGSARIEGNHTTLADYVESRVEASGDSSDQLHEIANIEKAMSHVDEVVEPGKPLTEHLVRALHDLTVKQLLREGDRTPGEYRKDGVSIAQSAHRPPEGIAVPSYMQELVHFINRPDPPKYDLMKVALAPHRFAWIHPFGNGNGRLVRLLTYAQLIKYGFNVRAGGRVLNPTAVFCNDRDKYYAMLAQADTGTVAGLEAWCAYVLQGILEELKKVDRLTDYSWLHMNILKPAVMFAHARRLISVSEYAVLMHTVQAGIVKSADLASVLPGMTSAQRTYQIKKLLDQGMLQPVSPGARQYVVGFASSYLLRGVIKALAENGFIPGPVMGETGASSGSGLA